MSDLSDFKRLVYEPEIAKLTNALDAERERATRLEECDCVPCIISSATCGKCGRRAVISQERFMEMVARSGETINKND